MRISIKPFNSCVMRRQKTAQYELALKKAGHLLVHGHADAEMVIIWTCAFRADFRDACLDAVKKIRKEAKGRVFAAGCMPDIAPHLLREIPGLEIMPWKEDEVIFKRLFGDTIELEAIREAYGEAQRFADCRAFRAEHPGADATFHDEFIKLVISEGCKYNCSYCSERLAFPPFKSFAPEMLAWRCKQLTRRQAGVTVMLMADSLGQYGIDIGTDFPSLVRLLHENGAPAFAFNNLNPASILDFESDLKVFIQDGWIRHLNLPIQSGSDQVLRRMNRNYDVNALKRIFDLLHRLGMRDYDTHVIIGFPGETDADVDETLSLLLQIHPRYVLLSTYMESPAAPAARLTGKIGRHVAAKRSAYIEEALQKAGILCNSDGNSLSQGRLSTLFG